MFVNREEELSYLERRVFFFYDLSSEQEQLRQFTDKSYQVMGKSFLETQAFTSWGGITVHFRPSRISGSAS